ncbi:tRNA (cytosine-5-)-methyltransferase [Aureococcus anophagefferens]|nr:tRNA (cytosine-5-)-methyltransferase [Aureococcus anophagefferens]
MSLEKTAPPMSSRSMSVSNSRPTDATESVRWRRDESGVPGSDSRFEISSFPARISRSSGSASLLPDATKWSSAAWSSSWDVDGSQGRALRVAAPELPPLEADDGYDDGYDDDEEDDFFAPPAEDAPVKSRKRKLEEAIAAQHVSAHSLERDYKETAPRRPRRRAPPSRARGRARGADAAGEEEKRILRQATDGYAMGY